MALVDLITCGDIVLATVDTDPSVSGVDLPLGSIASMTNGSATYLKTGAPATSWSKIIDSPALETRIAQLVDSSPATLDTLNELAAALGDDPNFATTMTNALAGKQPLDSDLTDIAGLSPANDDFMVRVSDRWSNRTIAQVKTLLGLVFGTGAEQYCQGNDSRLLENKRNDYVDHLTFNPVAAATYFFGGEFNVTPVVSDTDRKRIYVRTSAPLVLKKADYTRISGLSTGASTINVYVRLNNTTDYLIGTVDTSVGLIEHISNVAMAVPFVDGDFYTIKLGMPVFTTPPASYRSFATLYFERA